MPNTTVQLRASNGRFVCAEGGGGQPLVANRNAALEWESFVLIDLHGGTLLDGHQVALQAVNGQFVCAEGGGGREVVANRDAIGPWETFTLHKVNGTGAVVDGDAIALQANNGQHVCAEGGGGGPVVANRDLIGPWETFLISVLPPRHVRIEVESVHCADTEDVLGADELYLVGAAASRTNVTGKPILTKPISINNGQTRSFPVDQRVMFDGEVDVATTISVGLRAYDEDANRDWSNYGSMITKMGDDLANGLKELKPVGVVAGTVLKLGIGAAGLIMSLDQDDELGELAVDLPVITLPRPTSTRTWRFRETGIGFSTWDYTLRYRISVG
jgi:hypothetical protein